uniref:ovomucoid-like n=1 Tax=Myodes glareolus TaxID=447135 RepID=UPI0020212435|nr:ovomucoid-like [Myodes glareolus]
MLVFSGVQVMYITLSFLLCSESALIRKGIYRKIQCAKYYRLIACPREYSPVCGSDDNTYANICIYCIAFKYSRGYIDLAHYGEC